MENPKANLTETELVYEADRSPGGGAQVESRRRLRIAVERQSRASTFLTWTIIALMVVQIGIQVWQAVRP